MDDKYSTKRLSFRYILALLILASVSISTHLTASYIVKSQELVAAVVNISGRQRMLSQRCGFLSGQIITAPDEDKRKDIRKKLIDAIDTMETSHNALLNGDRNINIPKPSPQVNAMFYEPPFSVDKNVRDYITGIRAIANATDTELISANNSYFMQIVNTAVISKLLDSLDAVVRQYQSESEDSIARLLRIEAFLLIINLSGLVMVALLIFRPMSLRIEEGVKELQENNELLNKEIIERKKAEKVKNEFISVVSHELRTPLTSIQGSLGLLTGGKAGEVSPQAKKMLDIAYRNSHRLINLVNDILDTEKIESGKMDFHIKPVELMPLIVQAVDANRSYGEQFGVRFAVEDTLPGVRVNADSGRLMQVLTNLLSNAAKFSPSGDTVLISVSPSPLRGEGQSLPPKYLSGGEGGGLIRVSVTDHGYGIPEEFRSRIFQKFAQADSSDKRQKGGTGLGLSISKAIIERLGGTIGYKTETDVGTTFYFDLPELAGIKFKEAKGFPRILICEDDYDVANLIAFILKNGGFETDIAYTALDAKRFLEQNNYNAMTLDLILPDEDGIGLIRELRKMEKTKDLPIIVVSVNASEGYKELNGGFAIMDWLDKPIDTERLLSVVKMACVTKTDGKPCVLHIEDDPDVCHVVSTVLQNDMDVVCAGSLHEAKQKLGQRGFDMVILDLILPDGDGVDMLPYLKAIPVVIYSAKDVGRDISGKVAASLVKSRTSGEELLNTIRSILRIS